MKPKGFLHLPAEREEREGERKEGGGNVHLSKLPDCRKKKSATSSFPGKKRKGKDKQGGQ